MVDGGGFHAELKDLRSAALVALAFMALALFRVDPLLLILNSGLAGAGLMRAGQAIQMAKE